jgi:hypothetical protein
MKPQLMHVSFISAARAIDYYYNTM